VTHIQSTSCRERPVVDLVCAGMEGWAVENPVSPPAAPNDADQRIGQARGARLVSSTLERI
jgi:hypothetical protein